MSTQQIEPASKEWLELVDVRNGFALRHPPGWGTDRGVSGLLLSLTEPGTGSFRSSLNVIRRVQDTPHDLDGLARSSLSALSRILTDPLVIDLDSAVVAGHPARRFLIAYRQGTFALTSEQWMFLTGDVIWTISCGAATDRWQEVADAFFKMVETFRLEER